MITILIRLFGELPSFVIDQARVLRGVDTGSNRYLDAIGAVSVRCHTTTVHGGRLTSRWF